MPRKGRQVPQGEDRGPRTKAMSIYLSEEERKALDDFALHLGFQSKSSMVVYILECCMKGGFGFMAFFRLGNKFSKLVEESGLSYLDVPLPKGMKARREAALKAKKEKLTKQRLLEREMNERDDTDTE
ncbi:hypothetical protein H5P28_16615 [Ruficoccus amylovorans]|uniref:Uncharacterized protein n=1 Tax=Ruficoccus amylovorans TaxID=1804625 RepID=A0A842HHT3_9BACT|nr:hypothetical protein [Ruficoccus amylovorans]MBC2595889.1 hypothetical protein [Ruficoccus amylovorans]